MSQPTRPRSSSDTVAAQERVADLRRQYHASLAPPPPRLSQYFQESVEFYEELFRAIYDPERIAVLYELSQQTPQVQVNFAAAMDDSSVRGVFKQELVHMVTDFSQWTERERVCALHALIQYRYVAFCVFEQVPISTDLNVLNYFGD